MSIGKRAAQLIKERAWKNGTSFAHECSEIQCSDVQMRAWNREKASPSARVLAEMLQQGYDIEYILLGGNNGKT